MPPLPLTAGCTPKIKKKKSLQSFKHRQIYKNVSSHLRVTGATFTGIVPSCQLLVEKAAEDVRALDHSVRGILEEVSV